ncbi:hypothetical protein LJD22_11210 [Bacillus velezensis]|nr:hypothetical protein [Bacillus velezensis]
MTLHHFIGAVKELPIGEYGRNPTLKPISELKIKGDVNKCSQFKKIERTVKIHL